jgi:hypothetical protein
MSSGSIAAKRVRRFARLAVYALSVCAVFVACGRHEDAPPREGPKPVGDLRSTERADAAPEIMGNPSGDGRIDRHPRSEPVGRPQPREDTGTGYPDRRSLDAGPGERTHEQPFTIKKDE